MAILLCALGLKENHLLYEWWACGYTIKKFWIFSKGLVLASFIGVEQAARFTSSHDLMLSIKFFYD